MASTEKDVLEILGKCKNESLEKQIGGTEEFWKNWINNFKTDNNVRLIQ
jgi:hypothetical protein